MTDLDTDLDLDEDFDDLDEEEEAKRPKTKTAKKAAVKGIGAAAVANKLGANPKTFRAWLRRKADDLKLGKREPKARYTWATWKDPELVAIMKAWKDDPHERGAKKGSKKTATKATAKKKAPAKRKAKS